MKNPLSQPFLSKLTLIFVSTVLVHPQPLPSFPSGNGITGIKTPEHFWSIDEDLPTKDDSPIYRPVLNLSAIDINENPTAEHVENKNDEIVQSEPSSRIQTSTNILPEKASEEPVTLKQKLSEDETLARTILINFNNVGIIEFIRFISRVSNRNFVFDENDLQFNVTIISEEPTSIENILTALIQELRIHDLSLIEQGNNFIIHKNNKVNSISKVVSEDPSSSGPIPVSTEMVTQVFRLNTADPDKLSAVIRPLLSDSAIIEVIRDTNHLIVTDLVTNVNEIAKLIKNVDAPKNGLVIGQYVVRTSSIETLILMTEKIMEPIARDQPLTLVPHPAANSIFIVASPYLVEKTISIMQHLDQNQKTSKIFDFKEFKLQNPAFEPDFNVKEEVQLPPAGIFLNGLKYEPSEEGLTTTPELPTNATFSRSPGSFKPSDQQINFGGAPLLTPATAGASQTFEKAQREMPNSNWNVDSQGNWVLKVNFNPDVPVDPNAPPAGKWDIDTLGNWMFMPVAPGEALPSSESPKPKGNWELDELGSWSYMLAPEESVTVDRLLRPAQVVSPIPLAPRKKNQFYIHKLQYRRGEQIQDSLQRMAESLISVGRDNEELAIALASSQWLETSNSLIFTGAPRALDKIEYLVELIDQPLRQVFIEMLVMETTMTDSLNYGVTWGTRFAGGNTAGIADFTNNASPLDAALSATGVNGLGSATTPGTLPQVFTPNPNALTGLDGLSLGIIGQKIINKATGIEFNSIGALVRATQGRTVANVILNPKIITEDTVPAEIFVGQNIAYQTQAISNTQGSVITSNFEFRDIGTRLRVTPFLGNSNIVTLEIEEERTQEEPLPSGSGSTNANIGPNTRKNRTTTRVHVPNGYFLVISGMLEDNKTSVRDQVPCLGGVPIIGAAFKAKALSNNKQNLMLFIRPEIIDTEEEIMNLTKHQQNIFKVKRRFKQDWLFADEEALDFLNLKRTTHDDELESYEDVDEFN